jgi:hypothetical protein
MVAVIGKSTNLKKELASLVKIRAHEVFLEQVAMTEEEWLQAPEDGEAVATVEGGIDECSVEQMGRHLKSNEINAEFNAEFRRTGEEACGSRYVPVTDPISPFSNPLEEIVEEVAEHVSNGR